MKITCQILKGHKKKKDKTFYYFDAIDSSYNKQYEDLPQEYDIEYQLRIAAADVDGDWYELVSKRFTPDKTTTHFIHFHTETYAYDCSTGQLYCLTLEHNI